MSLIKKLMVALALLTPFKAPAASKLVVDAERTIKIQGEVSGSILLQAAKLEILSRKNSDPVYLIINSPGGSVIAGMVFMQAMDMAKARGVEIKCIVPVMAASMAMHIYGNCDTRYAFSYSLLLWHPARAGGSYSEEEAKRLAEDLRRIEAPLNERLIKALDIDPELFWKHYRWETLWTAEQLDEYCPYFMHFIDDVEGADELFSLQ